MASDSTVREIQHRREAEGRHSIALESNQHVASRRRRWKRRWTVRLVIIAALMAMLTLFAAANFVLVELRLVFWEGEVRLAWALLLACVTGFMLAVVVLRLPR